MVNSVRSLVLLLVTVLGLNVHAAVVDIVVFAGQSNATGVSADYSTLAGSTAVDDSTPFFYDIQGGTAAATHHTSFDLNTTLSGVSVQIAAGDPETPNRFGPEVGFARKIAELDAAFNLAVLKVSFGNSLVADWQKSTPGDFGDAYGERLIAGVNSAISLITGNGDTPAIRGLVWTHGERDSTFLSNEVAAQYQESFEQFISDFRADTGVADLPVMMVELHPFYNGVAGAFRDTVRAEQTGFVSGDADGFMISTSDLTLLSDNRHYGANEIFTIGERAAQSYFDNVSSVPEPVHGVIVGAALVAWGFVRRTRRR